jgi:integrase/recombinase XerD
MADYTEQFSNYLEHTKKMALNSRMAYLRDLRDFTAFLATRNQTDLTGSSEADVAAYLMDLKSEGKSSATVNRKLASIRAFYKYLKSEGIMSNDSLGGIKSPKIARKEIEYLTIEEVENLLAQPDKSDIGLRDTAILEVLYATGLRVSEAISANVDDVNLRMGFITCDGTHGKARIIPLGRPSRAALETYIYDDRNKLLRGKDPSQKALFLNYYGERLTRQALWKILKGYAVAAGIKKKITPQILRNSFAVHMVQNGADLRSLQELMGHEDLSSTQVYLSVARNRIKDVYDNTHPRA